jgi:hypothetical protein
LARERTLKEHKLAREEAEQWAAKQADKVPSPPIDPLAVLQRAWDAAPHEIRQQFATANAVELASMLALAGTPGAQKPLSKNAIVTKVDRAFARAQSTTLPAPPSIDLEIPSFLKR